MNLKQLIFLIICSLFLNSILAQSSNDSLKNTYSKKLIGSWIGENEFNDGRGSGPDNIFLLHDTLIFSNDSTFYSSRGGNLDKHWTGVVSTGNWEVNLIPVSYIQFKEKFNNRKLEVSRYVFTIVKVTETEFTFINEDKSYVYKRMKKVD